MKIKQLIATIATVGTIGLGSCDKMDIPTISQSKTLYSKETCDSILQVLDMTKYPGVGYDNTLYSETACSTIAYGYTPGDRQPIFLWSPDNMMPDYPSVKDSVTINNFLATGNIPSYPFDYHNSLKDMSFYQYNMKNGMPDNYREDNITKKIVGGEEISVAKFEEIFAPAMVNNSINILDAINNNTVRNNLLNNLAIPYIDNWTHDKLEKGAKIPTNNYEIVIQIPKSKYETGNYNGVNVRGSYKNSHGENKNYRLIIIISDDKNYEYTKLRKTAIINQRMSFATILHHEDRHPDCSFGISADDLIDSGYATDNQYHDYAISSLYEIQDGDTLSRLDNYSPFYTSTSNALLQQQPYDTNIPIYIATKSNIYTNDMIKVYKTPKLMAKGEKSLYEKGNQYRQMSQDSHHKWVTGARGTIKKSNSITKTSAKLAGYDHHIYVKGHSIN